MKEKFDPKPVQCRHCDFGFGMRGMDRCGRCNGTGSGFWVKGKFYPNTKFGYLEAEAAYNSKV